MTKWLLLLYRMPRLPSAPRVAIWRALKRVEGGEYLQDGVFVVKANWLNEVTLEDLAHDIWNAGGEATIATGNVDDEARLLSRLKTTADATRVTVQPRPSNRRVKRGGRA